MRPVTPAAELAVVVLSHGNDDTILAAVDSVLAQDEPVELVVSHSGPGRVQDLLPGVRVVASSQRRLPGAARNAGVAATSAPFVAFLSGDARARPGWVSGRLAR
ncbi:MAG: glycosyltransferase family 2 protein, partial [Actinomycetota bacterium]|nr:glycosyltransferase family 2 protein [Actinomycetota bacterium]